jgi:hypothetical protein
VSLSETHEFGTPHGIRGREEKYMPCRQYLDQEGRLCVQVAFYIVVYILNIIFGGVIPTGLQKNTTNRILELPNHWW